MAETRRDFLLLLLSLAAGCVDAIAFLHSGVFPANMTGNSVVLALALVRVNTDGALLSAVALGAYCLGAAAGSWLTHSPQPGRSWSHKTSLTLFIAGFLLLGCAVALGCSGTRFIYSLIAIASAAMGMQSAAVLRLGVGGVATVVVTGTLTTAILRLSEKCLGAAPSQESPWLPALSWLAYFIGALLGAFPTLFQVPWLFALPGLLLLTVARSGLPAKTPGTE